LAEWLALLFPLMLVVSPYAWGHGFDSQSRLFIVWTNLCFSSFTYFIEI
jgi:hypothetical protein